MVQIKYILPVVYLLLFMQCTKPAEPRNDTELRNDIDTLKRQVAFHDKMTKKEIAQLKGNYVKRDQLRYVKESLIIVQNGLRRALNFPVQFFESYEKDELNADVVDRLAVKDLRGPENKLIRSVADCKAALEQLTELQSSNVANSVPPEIHTPTTTITNNNNNNNNTPSTDGNTTEDEDIND